MADCADQCVEIVGGSESRRQALALAGLEVELVARPSGAQRGGDLYCLHSCRDRTVAKIALLDVTGHGTRAALVAQTVHTLLHRFGDDTQPSHLLNLLNEQFAQSAPPGVLATSLCAVYDSRQKEFRYAYGGQPRILFWSARSRQWRDLGPSWDSACGVPLGVTAKACYEEQTISLQPQDLLFMFSDGVPETQSPTGGLLRPEGVLRLAQECLEDFGRAPFPLSALADAFLRRFAAFHGGGEFQDDLTLLWARRQPDGP